LAAPMLRLRERGVGFALDHFGRATGSLANLRALPFTAVKIDGSFCRGVTEDPRARSMVLAVVQLAHAFDLDAIATHVESDAVRKTIVDLGADFGQGFLIGRPCALAEALGDLPLYSCFSTSTGLFDQIVGRSAARA
ncbi:MAG: EAL domain-containing protein, partial [Gammaproteobacteria bacterium]|nr:EAL domain-containing protein [Gammaproteobacteria bacterium]